MNDKLKNDILKFEIESKNVKNSPKYVDSKINTKGYNKVYKLKKQRGRS